MFQLRNAHLVALAYSITMPFIMGHPVVRIVFHESNLFFHISLSDLSLPKGLKTFLGIHKDDEVMRKEEEEA